MFFHISTILAEAVSLHRHRRSRSMLVFSPDREA
jgi:hypothetical protein